MMFCMYDLAGKFTRKTGTNGTETLPVGAIILRVWAHASADATVNILGAGATVVKANTILDLVNRHLLDVARGTPTVVFTTTDSYVLEYVELGKG